MRMTLHTDYALRTLIYLAVRPDQLITVRAIADSYGLSRNHLLKVALNLNRGGFIETVRGRSGGLRLAKPAGEITVGAVVRHLEEDFALVECLRAGGGLCSISSLCRMKEIFRDALAAFLTVLDSHTIGDVAKDSDALAALLGFQAAAPCRRLKMIAEAAARDEVNA